jgi:DNA-binding transcriptional ArsR family regulator
MHEGTHMEDVVVARASEIFAALSNPVRLRIVEWLCVAERSVGEVAIEMGIGPSGASQHLSLLARAGILVATAQGSSRLYKVRGPRVPAILKLIDEFCHFHVLYGVPPGEPEEQA